MYYIGAESALRKEVPGDPDPEIEKWTEERAAASTAKERDISPGTARRRELTAGREVETMAAEGEETLERGLESRSVHLQAGTIMSPALPAREKKTLKRE